MVKLKTKHLIMLSRVMDKMDISFRAGETQEQTGANLMTDIVRNLYKAEDELYALLGDLTGMESVEDMEIKDLIGELKAVVTELINFIKTPETSAK